MSVEFVRELFDDLGRRLSRRASKHIEAVCSSLGLPVATWFRWWLECRPASATYDNIVMSPKTDSAFGEWLKGERMYAPKRVALQMDALKMKLKDAVLTPGEELKRPIRGVGPLVQFTLGRYLDCPLDVEWLRRPAADELAAKPWLEDALSRYREFLPETENSGKQ